MYAWRDGLKPSPLLTVSQWADRYRFRRTHPMGTFQDRTSMERILFAVFLHANLNQGLSIPSP